MIRKNIENSDGVWVGWFNAETAENLASYYRAQGRGGKQLIVTKKGKLVINEWFTGHYDIYRFATNEQEIVEIICKDPDYTEKDIADEKIKKILDLHEV